MIRGVLLAVISNIIAYSTQLRSRPVIIISPHMHHLGTPPLVLVLLFSGIRGCLVTHTIVQQGSIKISFVLLSPRHNKPDTNSHSKKADHDGSDTSPRETA